MKIQRLQVEAEIEFREIEALGPGKAERHVIELLRGKAEREAAAVGGRLVTDTMPEMVVAKRASVLTNQDFLLVGTRWLVEVPDSFVLPSA